MCQPKLRDQVLGSSANGEKLSLTVKGLLLGAVPIVVSIIRLTAGVDIPESELNELINNIALFVQQATILISLGTVVVGLVRKVIVRLKV